MAVEVEKGAGCPGVSQEHVGVREGHIPLLQNYRHGWFPSSTPLAGKLLEGEATSYFFNLFYHQCIGHERITTFWCLVTMYSGEENLGMTMFG